MSVLDRFGASHGRATIGGRICTYQQAHVVEKSVSLMVWRRYQSIKKHIETRTTWPRARLADCGQAGEHTIHRVSNISKMTRARTTSIPGTLSLVALVSLDLNLILLDKSSPASIRIRL
jgi:hypothetical protein